jgi:hypothetical protein
VNALSGTAAPFIEEVVGIIVVAAGAEEPTVVAVGVEGAVGTDAAEPVTGVDVGAVAEERT